MDEVQFDGARLDALMKERGIGDTDLARQAGVSRTMIYYLKKGKRKTAKVEIISKIARALNTTVAYLLGEGEAGQAPMVRLPESIRQLAEIAAKMSVMRQEELLRIAATLLEVEREQNSRPATREEMEVYNEIAEELRGQGGNEDLLLLLRRLLLNPPPRWLIDLNPPDEPPDEPPDGE